MDLVKQTIRFVLSIFSFDTGTTIALSNFCQNLANFPSPLEQTALGWQQKQHHGNEPLNISQSPDTKILLPVASPVSRLTSV